MKTFIAAVAVAAGATVCGKWCRSEKTDGNEQMTELVYMCDTQASC